MSTAISILALLVSLVALVLVVRTRRPRPADGAGTAADLPEDARGLRHEVAALRAEGDRALRHLAVVRYDAYADMGGGLSWSMAMLDEQGNGAVITSIHGRSEARSYAKSIVAWSCEQPLSEEEAEAVSRARR